MKKNSAPFILFGFLGVLVLCLVVSVVIAIKHPVQEDDSYFLSKKEIDSQINQIIKEHQEFSYRVYVGNELAITPSQRAYPPFLQTRNQGAMHIKLPYSLYLGFAKNEKFTQVEDVSVMLYLQKINSADSTIELGAMDKQGPLFVSKTISELPKGRYKAIFEVILQASQEPKRLFFEKEIFID